MMGRHPMKFGEQRQTSASQPAGRSSAADPLLGVAMIFEGK